MGENIKKHLGIGFWLIITIGLILRFLAFFKNPSFGFAESALAFNILDLNFFEYFNVLHFQQVAPPLFMALTKCVVTLFGMNEFVFRLIPFSVGILCFIPFYFLLKHIFEKQSTINFAMLLFAVNPTLIYYGCDLKTCIIDVFFSILIFLLMLKIDLKTDSIKKLIFTGCLFAIAMWLSFPSIIVCGIGLLTLLISQKNFKKWLLLTSPVLINFVLFILYYLNITSLYENFMVHVFIKDFNHFTVPIKYFFDNEFAMSVIIVSFALIAGIIYFMMEKKKLEITYILWIFITMVILSHLHLYPMYERFTLFFLPFVIIILAMTFDILISKKNVQSRIVLLIILIALLPLSDKNLNDRGSQARELTTSLLESIKPDDIIVVDKFSLPEFLYYTYTVDIHNKIITSFITKNNRILTTNEPNTQMPVDTGYWYFNSRTNKLNSHINPEKITNKLIGKNGMVLKIGK